MDVKKRDTRSFIHPVPLLLTAFLLLLGQIAEAQSLILTGNISNGTNALPSATVQLLSFADSTVLLSAVTDSHGFFLLENKNPQDRCILKATYIGYRPWYKELRLSKARDTVSIGIIKLREDAIHLQAVTVNEQRDAIVIKTDTIEYRAESFQTMPNANVESLLRKLPGLEVQRNGNINAGAEPVLRVYLNGKEVFGNNLQLITQNLPAEAIDKIQIIDDRSHGDRFSSTESASPTKAINIELKPEYQKMRFGSIAGGMGNEERYAADVNLNHFNKGNQLTAIAKSNNINNLDLHRFDNARDASEPLQGLLTTHSGAINALRNLSENLSVNGSYHGNLTDNLTETSMTRQSLLPDGLAKFSEQNDQSSQTSGHQAVAGVQHSDAVNSLRVTMSGNLSEINSRGNSNRHSTSHGDENGYSGERSYSVNNVTQSGNALFFYGRRLGKKNRTVTVDASYALHDNHLRNKNYNHTLFNDGTTSLTDQLNDQRNTSEGYMAKLSYTEPIRKKHQIKIFYSLSDRSSESLTNFQNISKEMPLLDPGKSGEIHSDFSYQQLGLTYQFKGKLFTFLAGSEVQRAELAQKSSEADARFQQHFESILPHAVLTFKLSDRARLNIRYNTAVREPLVNELQPLESRTDPLNVYLPNLNLRPEYSHRGTINFNTSDRKASSFFLSANARATYVRNPITQAFTIDNRQIRIFQYINTESSGLIGANLDLSLPLTKLNSSLKLSSFSTYRENINFINGLETPQTRISYGGQITYSYAHTTNFDLNARAFYNTTSIENLRGYFPSQVFVTSGLNGGLAIITFKRIRIAGTFSYTRLQNMAVDFDEFFPMLNVACGVYLFRNNAGELILSGNNLLGQNESGLQSAEANGLEQRINETILGRIFMLSFSYRFSSPK